MKPLTGKVALVTGGSRGIGAGIVRALAAAGAQVAFTYVQAAAPAQALVVEFERQGGTVLALSADVASRAAMQTALAAVMQRFGHLDILVNNAGLFTTGAVDDATVNEPALARLWQVNTTGVAHTVRDAVELLPVGGRIITIGSRAARHSPSVGVGDYAARKAALAAYTRSWARDLAAMLQPVALGRFGTPAR